MQIAFMIQGENIKRMLFPRELSYGEAQDVPCRRNPYPKPLVMNGIVGLEENFSLMIRSQGRADQSRAIVVSSKAKSADEEEGEEEEEGSVGAEAAIMFYSISTMGLLID